MSEKEEKEDLTDQLIEDIRALALEDDNFDDFRGLPELETAFGSLVREGNVQRPTHVTLLSDFSQKTILPNDENPDHSESFQINPNHSNDPLTFNKILENLKNGKYKRIMFCVGAGISTAAGIPDFRTPGTGLYDNLKEYNLSQAEDVFDISYFSRNPIPFYTLAKELRPGQFTPTMTHHMIALVAEAGMLLRCYTQNIDGLERLAGLDEEKLVEAHGTFSTASCPSCKVKVDIDLLNQAIDDGSPLECYKCSSNDVKESDSSGSGTFIKPDIVFFGENLPEKFFYTKIHDVTKTDLCITMGTSLSVPPFAFLPEEVSQNSKCDQLLVNRDRVGPWCYEEDPISAAFTGWSVDRAAFYEGNTDDAALKIAEALGLGDKLKRRIQIEKT
jgi:NAD-dependent SIR2 family protein deacetylase